MQFFNNLSIRYKITLGFLIVVLIFVLKGVSSNNSLSLVYDTFKKVSNENQVAVEKALMLNAQIESVFGAMGLYLLTGEATQEKEFVEGLSEISQSMTLLKEDKAIADDEESIELINDVEGIIVQIQSIQPNLIKLSKDSNLNILAVGYAQDNLNPLNREMLQLLSQMLTSEDEEEYIEERKELLHIIHKLRYNWSSVMTELRLYLAFKAPAALDNIKLYSESADEMITRLIELQDNDDLLTLDQSDSLEQFVTIKKTFMSNLDELIELHASDKWRQDSFIVKTQITPFLRLIKGSIDRLISRQKQNISAAQTQVDTIYTEQTQQFYVVLVIVLLIALGIALFLSQLITKSLMWAVDLAQAISKGNLKNDIQVRSTDEIGALFKALGHMQDELNSNIETERVISRENSRVKTALDNISGNVIVIDHKDKIVYVNNMAKQLYDRISQLSLEKGLDSHVLGNDVFINSHDECEEYSIEYGEFTILVTSNKIYSEEGELLGKVYEIEDKTSELVMEEEIANVVTLAMGGDLTTKIDLTSKTGFFSVLSNNTNELLSIVENALNSLNISMQSLAKGDLTQDIKHNHEGVFGEVEQAASDTVTQLRNITSKITLSAKAIDEISSEISHGNSNLSNRSEQQASALQKTSASIEELTSTVLDNTKNTEIATNLSEDAQQVAKQGGDIIKNAIDAMDQINHSSNKIADIISVIDEIAFQTNLLALNASVEAARAGEQGRGFAVVATEVRNLAQRSATAAKEIKDLIHDSVEKVKVGSKLVNDSGNSLIEIETGVKKVVDIIAEISTASNDQARGIEEVNEAILSMDTLTQQNAALAEQVTAASINLSERSSIMQQDVSFFITDQSTSHNVIVEKEVQVEEKKESIAEKKKPVVTKTMQPAKHVEEDITHIDLDDEWEEF